MFSNVSHWNSCWQKKCVTSVTFTPLLHRLPWKRGLSLNFFLEYHVVYLSAGVNIQYVSLNTIHSFIDIPPAYTLLYNFLTILYQWDEDNLTHICTLKGPWKSRGQSALEIQLDKKAEAMATWRNAGCSTPPRIKPSLYTLCVCPWGLLYNCWTVYGQLM